MSDTQKENWITLGKVAGSVGLLILSLLAKDWLDTQKERDRKIDTMYEYVLVQNIRDSLRDTRIMNIEVRLNIHQNETSNAIQALQQSMIESYKQMSGLPDNRPHLNQH